MSLVIMQRKVLVWERAGSIAERSGNFWALSHCALRISRRGQVDSSLAPAGAGLLVAFLVPGPFRLHLDHSVTVGAALSKADSWALFRKSSLGGEGAVARTGGGR